ncbi:MAG: hypothetical protein ACFCD0_20310 [Gemmataceae bacterium]
MLKLLGNVLLTASVVVGALAAATAYHVPLDAPESDFQKGDGERLTIKSSSGVVLLSEDEFARVRQSARTKQLSVDRSAPELYQQQVKALSRLKPAQLEKVTRDEETGLVLLPNGLPVSLAAKDDILTPELLAELRKQGKSVDPRVKQRYVIVREFSWSRWPGLIYFIGSIGGLVLGAVLIRMGNKPKETNQVDHHTIGPEATLASLQTKLVALHKDVTGSDQKTTDSVAQDGLDLPDVDEKVHAEAPSPIPDVQIAGQPIRREGEVGMANETVPSQVEVSEVPNKLKMILDRLEDAQKLEVAGFIESRTEFIQQFGLGRYAEVMDRFAACERQINRSWSAAADGVYEESLVCLDAAIELVQETQERLRAVMAQG